MMKLIILLALVALASCYGTYHDWDGTWTRNGSGTAWTHGVSGYYWASWADMMYISWGDLSGSTNAISGQVYRAGYKTRAPNNALVYPHYYVNGQLENNTQGVQLVFNTQLKQNPGDTSLLNQSLVFDWATNETNRNRTYEPDSITNSWNGHWRIEGATSGNLSFCLSLNQLTGSYDYVQNGVTYRGYVKGYCYPDVVCHVDWFEAGWAVGAELMRQVSGTMGFSSWWTGVIDTVDYTAQVNDGTKHKIDTLVRIDSIDRDADCKANQAFFFDAYAFTPAPTTTSAAGSTVVSIFLLAIALLAVLL